jgi:periplasmic divalent cation tolerance protein
MELEEIIVYVTSSKEEEAFQIGRAVVEDGLAACVNIIPQISSIYRWKGEICEDHELLLIIKTRREMYKPLELRIKELHSYEVPEIIAVGVSDGSESYIKWIRESTKGKGRK